MPISVAAQDISQIYDVPSTGYGNTDTYSTENAFNEYRVHVPRNYELEYSVQIEGEGSFTVFLVPGVGTDHVLMGNYYIDFSSPEPVSSFNTIFPANSGFAEDYTIAVNSTGNITYDMTIRLNELDTSSYMIYYVLIGLGAIGLVIFAWFFVNWQYKQEKLAEEKARQERKSQRGRGKKSKR